MANNVDATPDVLLLGYPNVDAIHDVDVDPNLLDFVDVLLLVLLLLPNHHLDVDAASDLHPSSILDVDDLLLLAAAVVVVDVGCQVPHL